MELQTLCVLLGIVLVAQLDLIIASNATSQESLLRKKLLKNYDKVILPIRKPGNVVRTFVDIGLSQIIDVDEVLETAKLSLWYRQYWYDEWLTWNETEYNVKSLTFKSSEIWIPDLTIYNQFPASDTRNNYYIYVSPSGYVNWRFPLLISVSCGMNMQYFPFDTQICKLVIGSWAFADDVMTINSTRIKGDLDIYLENVEWDVKDFVIRRHVIKYSCCTSTKYVDVTFSVIMKRRSLHYVWNLVIPCIAILAVHFLGFLLPPASGEKISLGITALLAFTVNLLMISGSLPPNSRNIPIMARFFGICIVFMGCANGCDVISLNLYHRGEYGARPPKWVRTWILLKLGRLFCISGSVLRADQNPTSNSRETVVETFPSTVCDNDSDPKQSRTSSAHPSMDNEEVEVSADQRNLEWSLVSLVITRITMIIYFIACVGIIVWFFATPPPFSMPDPDDKKGY